MSRNPLDLGIAKYFHAAHMRTTGQKRGTPAYMAPEQIDSIIHPHTDVYALAMMTWEMLVGRYCWAKGPKTQGMPDTRALIIRIMHHKPPLLATVLPGALRELSDLIDWAVEKDPDARPDMARFVHELEQVAGRYGVAPAPVPANVTTGFSFTAAVSAARDAALDDDDDDVAAAHRAPLPAAGTPAPSIRETGAAYAMDTDPAPPPSDLRSNSNTPVLVTQKLGSADLPPPPSSAISPERHDRQPIVHPLAAIEPTPSPMVTRSSPTAHEAEADHASTETGAPSSEGARGARASMTGSRSKLALRALMWAIPIGTAFGAPLLIFQLATKSAATTAEAPSPDASAAPPSSTAAVEVTAAPPVSTGSATVDPEVHAATASSSTNVAAASPAPTSAARAPATAAAPPRAKTSAAMPGSGLDAPKPSQPKAQPPPTPKSSAKPAAELPFDPSKPFF